MARKKKKTVVPKILILICVIAGIVTIILQMLNRRIRVQELGEIEGYSGTAFAISLLIIIGLLVVSQINKK